MSNQERGDIDLLPSERAMQKEELLGVELVVAVTGEDCVAKDAVEIADGHIMNVGGIQVVVGSGTDIRQTVP